MSELRYLRQPEVRSRTGLSTSTIYRLEKRGDFPKRIMLTTRCAAWDEAEVTAWLERRKTHPIPPNATPWRQLTGGANVCR